MDIEELKLKVLKKAQEREPYIKLCDIDIDTTGPWCDYCEKIKDCKFGYEIQIECAVRFSIKKYKERINK